jgi:polyhydroxybutyrate depolymerase
MNTRRNVLIAVLVLINLPMALSAIEAASYYYVNRSTGTIVSSGLTREYRLYVPPSYDAAKPAPLVISMHGAGLWPAAQMDLSQWNATADQHGFIVAYPSAVRGDGPAVWKEDDPQSRDSRFISDLIDALRASYHIDPARIYADGMSNGGGMAFALSCTLGDRIAAVGIVGSAQLAPRTWCPDPRPVPVIAFHGTADSLARYEGGLSWISSQPFPNIPGFVAAWARRNHCADTPVDTRVTGDVIRRTYTGCADRADVELYTVEGGGHTWPGGGALPEWFAGSTTHSISASTLSWEFFQNHPLSR